MSDELDLDAGITFCGSWDPDDCAFTADGAPIVWACGFHSLVTELRELRESLAASKASTAKARTRAANAEAQRDDALAASTRLAARVNRGEPVVILGKRYIHVPSQPVAHTVPMDVRAAKYDRIERDHPPRWWNRGGTASAVTLLHDWWGWFRR